ISELRAALGDDPKTPRFIETASRRGYRFIGAAMPAAPGQQEVQAEIPRMIGRAAALQRLRDAWNHALAGRRQVGWVTGEAGGGESPVVEAFLSERDPRRWVVGQCVEHWGAGEPYLPLIEGLTVLCRRDPSLVAGLRAAAPTWLAQM